LGPKAKLCKINADLKDKILKGCKRLIDMTSPIQLTLSQVASNMVTSQQPSQIQQSAQNQQSSATQVAIATQVAANRDTNNISKESKNRTVQVPPRPEKRGDAPALKARSPRSPKEEDQEPKDGPGQDKVDLVA